MSALAGWPGFFFLQISKSETPEPEGTFMGSFAFGLALFSVLAALPFVILALLSHGSWMPMARVQAAARVGRAVAVIAWGLFALCCAAYAARVGGMMFGWLAVPIAIGAPVVVSVAMLLGFAVGPGRRPPA